MSAHPSSEALDGDKERALLGDYSGEEMDFEHAVRARTTLQRHRICIVLNLLLGLICTALSIVVLSQRRAFQDTFGCSLEQGCLTVLHTPGIEPPMMGPEFQKRTVLFERNESFIGRADQAYPAWHELLHHARHGRVAFDSRPGEFYGYAGYHQMHCVWLMQQAVTDADVGRRPSDIDLDHLYHCVEYLRLSVMCYADPTLERRYEGVLGPFSANNTHICGDWGGLTEWGDEHKYKGVYLNPTGKLPP